MPVPGVLAGARGATGGAAGAVIHHGCPHGLPVRVPGAGSVAAAGSAGCPTEAPRGRDACERRQGEEGCSEPLLRLPLPHGVPSPEQGRKDLAPQSAHLACVFHDSQHLVLWPCGARLSPVLWDAVVGCGMQWWAARPGAGAVLLHQQDLQSSSVPVWPWPSLPEPLPGRVEAAAVENES